MPPDLVTFQANGAVLSGTLHSPAAETSGAGVVLLSGGLNRRAGLHRMYLEAAHRLAEAGAWVLRLDFPGVGESTGKIKAVTPSHLLSLDAIYVEETGAAVSLLTEKASLSTVALLGHCNGARSAIAAAASDPRVSRVITWSMPIRSENESDPTVPGEIEDALLRLVEKRTPALFLYGTQDPSLTEFQSFWDTILSPAQRASAQGIWELSTIPQANHDFTAAAWTDEAIRRTIEGLRASAPR